MLGELKETRRTKGNSKSNVLTNRGSIYTHCSKETSKNSDEEDAEIQDNWKYSVWDAEK